MRKFNKKILVAVLAVVLLFVSAAPATYSWFTRPQELEGNSLKWDGILYDANSDTDDITISTTVSDDGETMAEDGKTYPTALTTDSVTLSADGCKYYCTEITNTGSTDKTVSLYLPSLSPSKALYLGVQNPAKTYKLYDPSGATSTKTSSSTMRVYLQPKNIKEVWDTGSAFCVAYKTSSSSAYTYIDLTQTNSTSSGVATYYADIPTSTTTFFFSIQSWEEDWQRTKDISVDSSGISSTQSIVYWPSNPSDSGYKDVNQSTVTGANIVNYYSSVTMPVGGTFSAGLTKGTDYTGSIAYSSSNTSVFTVDSSGNITGVAAGTATLTYTVTGTSYSDTITKTCSVTVSSSLSGNSLTDVPIVTNLTVSKAVDDETPGKSYVYWYIKNSYGSGTLTYSISNISLTL